ncbi:hypothetical protein BGZ49_001099 [Haplosporangium sp. Z 27]|nr:hypothetical protein BGZ49_001099 [Haplosporangium sp. Z 27]
MFHPAFALDDFETEDLEQALVDPSSLAYLVDLQARMLRTLTQDRRISFDNWIKYAQKEFEKRAEDQNPWVEEDAYNYEGFSLATKLMILGNLCEWQLDDPERFRSNFKEEEEVAVEWRVDPIGLDANDRTYWLFDDNRLYRENPPPKKNPKSTKQAAAPPKPKPTPASRRGTRRSTRGHKGEESPEPDAEPEFETPPITPGIDWEPVCISQVEWEEFATLFRRSKHPDEKALHALINNDILPKVLGDFKEKEKEREKLEAIANRKRSSRIVIRELEIQEKARLDAIRQQEIQAAAEQRRKELQERRAERERQQQHQIRDSRLKEREKRLKAREEAIWQREAKKKQQQLKIGKEREERNQRRLQGGQQTEHSGSEAGNHNEEEEEEDWVFDCVCGVHGTNLDDGELMIACGKCNVWQHVACLKQEDAAQGRSVTDWATFDFICPRCIIKEQKKAVRKEKRDQKVKMEAAMTNGVSTGPNSAKGTKKETKAKKPPQARKASNVSTTPINGQYAHGPSQYPTPYASQYSQPPLQPYHNQPPYHQSSGPMHSSQTYYSGHPSGHQDQTQTQYPYQSPPQLQHQTHYLPSQSPQQPQQFRQQFQPQPSQAHYGSQGMPQPYQSYSSSPMNSIQAPISYNHHSAPSQHYPLQGDYSTSRQPQSYPSNNGSYSQQYRTDVSVYGASPVSPGYSSQGVLAGSAGIVQKRVNPMEDEMEGVERPPKIMNNHQ